MLHNIVLFFIQIIVIIILNKITQNKTIYDNNKKFLKLTGLDYKFSHEDNNSIIGIKIKFKNFDESSMKILRQRINNIIMNTNNFTAEKVNNKKYIKLLSKEETIKCMLNEEVNSLDELKQKLIDSKIHTLISINNKNGELYVYWNHAIMDGIRMINICQNFLNYDCKISKIPKLELNGNYMLYSIFNTIKLNNLCNYNNNIKPEVYKFKINQNIINEIQNKYNSTFNGAFMKYMLDYLNIDTCLTAMITPGIRTNQFNSYGILPFNYYKLNNAKDIDNKLLKNYGYTFLSNLYLMNYHLLNNNQESNLNIDVLFSGLSFCKEEPKVGNMILDDFEVNIPFQTTPVYIFSLKCKDTIHITVSVVNKEINDKIKEIN